ncbi:MAG: hypothetical protein WEC99_04005 [Halofilum sp. (in: g-proteobacteria)]
MDRSIHSDTSASTALRLQFECPFTDSAYRSDGFVGAWSPYYPLRVTSSTGESSQAAHLHGPNWFVCSAVARLPSGHRAKIHVDRSQDRALAFRGYVVDPPLHQFSVPDELWRYWGSGGGDRPNGVFAMALVEGSANRLTLKTDAFGFSPLYYRITGDFVLFGTKPDFLVTDRAELDPLGAATLMANNHPLGDRTLLRDIYRCPFGTALRFEGSVEAHHERWFTADDLPDPDQPLDDTRTSQAERAFNEAVRRVTALDYGPTNLPLTSGYDSRRILGALLDQQQSFSATTVRVYRNGGRDLDARCASELAQRYGFDHRIVDLPAPHAYAEDDALRCRELCAETRMHDGWPPSLMRTLPAEPSVLVEGLLGDVLGYPGYRLENADFYKNPAADIELIADDVAHTLVHAYVAEPFLPGEKAREELRQYLAPLASKRNVAELAYMLLRQRRATALWSQQLIAPEHLVASPYVDLDHICTVMAVRPQERCHAHLQRLCLEQFHPELAAVAGSHAIPADAIPVGAEGNRQRALACFRRLTRRLDSTHNRGLLRERLTPLGRAVTAASGLAPGHIQRWRWVVRPVCETLLHDQSAPAVWRTAA